MSALLNAILAFRESALEVILLLIGLGCLFAVDQAVRQARRDARRAITSPRSTSRPHSRGSFTKPFDSATARPVEERTSIIKGRAWVIDGDSIVIDKVQIRLFGIDAPEMNHPYGKAAKWEMVKLCKGQIIRAEVTEVDAHGRTVAKCTLPDGRDLSAELVKAGLAIDWPKFSGGCYRTLEVPDARRKMWLADARQKGRMHVWEQFEARQAAKAQFARD